MFRDIWDELWSPYASLFDRFLAAFMALCLVIVVGLIGLVGFIAVDSIGVTPTKTAVVAIEAKEYTPPYTTTGFMQVGQVMVPTTTYHPESYYLRYTVDGERVGVSVSAQFYNSVVVGDRMEVNYGAGRLSGGHTPVNVRRVE